MALQLLVEAGAAERISFGFSPLWEAAASLHVLADPKHHAVHVPWVLQARKIMSPELRRRLRTFAFCWQGPISASFSRWEGGAFADFTTELEQFRNLDPQLVADDLEGGLHRFLGRPDDLVEAAAARDPELGKLAARLKEDPAAVRESLAATMALYWEQVFQRRWEDVEPILAQEVAEKAKIMATDGMWAMLRRLAPQLQVNPEANTITIRMRHEASIDLRTADEWLIIPSYYAWPHVWVEIDPRFTPAITYPVPATHSAAQAPLPPAELEQVLTALGSVTRMQVLQLLAQRPHSTQEMAQILHMAEGAVSRHLRLLTQAGLLTQQRQGYYVLYGLQRSRLTQVADQIGRLGEQE